jgi:arabinogalactan oligomer/maltooligosaccharide transport system permease protein
MSPHSRGRRSARLFHVFAREFAVLPALAALVLAALSLLLPHRAFAAEPLRVWHAYRGDEEKALLAILDAWKQHGGAGRTVEALSVPFDAYATKLRSAIAIGEGPDIYIDAHERLGDYKARGIVAKVGDALESEGAFLGPALDAVRLGGDIGDIYALPLSQKCIALYVNTDLVKDVPPDLEGIIERKASLPEGVFPLVYEAANAYFHAAILGSFGGSLLTDKDAFGFVGQGAERSVDLVKSFIDKGAVPEDADGALVTNLFRSGRAAYAMSGPWLANDLGGAKLRYRVEPLPRVRATGQPMRPLLTVESVMMSPKGALRPEVRELTRYLAGAEAARMRTRLVRVPLVRTDVDVAALGLPEADMLFLRAFTEQAKVAIPIPASTAMGAAWDPSNKALKKALRRRDLTSDVVLLEARRRFDDVRRPPPPPPTPPPPRLGHRRRPPGLAFKWLKSAERGALGPAIRRSIPAYKYVTHAVLAVGVLVVIPLLVGAATSLFVGSRDDFRYVGLANFISILTARGGDLFANGSFYVVLTVTLLWTVANLFVHLALGVSLALLLARPSLRFRAAYRVLLIVPWAVPSYVTALAWKGMFHRQFGAVTGIIQLINSALGLDIEPIAWFSRFSTAFTANLATNGWLGFPFMMVVTLGALTAVPEDVLEAAKVDGATRFQRLRLVTLPMIAPTLAPAVTLGAIWTFNMFNVVFLVSGGDPDGSTEILVSEAYRWAFTREGQYGYAAAYSVLIFILLLFITRLTSRSAEAPKPHKDGTIPGEPVPQGTPPAAAHLQTEAAR